MTNNRKLELSVLQAYEVRTVADQIWSSCNDCTGFLPSFFIGNTVVEVFRKIPTLCSITVFI